MMGMRADALCSLSSIRFAQPSTPCAVVIQCLQNSDDTLQDLLRPKGLGFLKAVDAPLTRFHGVAVEDVADEPRRSPLSGLRSHLSKELARAFPHFFRRKVLFAGRQVPLVPEWVGHLPESIAPKHIRYRHIRTRTG